MSRQLRSFVLLLVLATVTSLVANLLLQARADGLSNDILHLASSWAPSSQVAKSTDERTVIVAIDEETYRQPPFEHTPEVAWTPQIATVLNALLDGGVKVIGIDTIFNQSLHYVGDLVPDMPEAAGVFANYDRDLLRVLAKGGRNGRIVMSYTQLGGKTVQPTAAQINAVGGAANLHPTNMFSDPDGILRQGLLNVPAAAPAQTVTSLPMELFARSGDHKIAFSTDHPPVVDGTVLTNMAPDRLLINFKPVAEDPPIYSFADLFACAQQGRSDYFKEHFAGRTVILGTVLDVEDRHLTAKRFATNPMGRNYAARCALPPMPGLASDHASAFIPGSYVLATIVDNLKNGNWLQPAGTVTRLLCLFILSLASCLLITHARSRLAVGGFVLLLLVWLAATVIAFQHDVVLPLIAGNLAAAISLTLALVYRVMLVDRGRRQLRRSFSLYLPTAEVDRLTARDELPALGGELRPVTILFSDIAGYSTLSEDLAPADLVTDLNRYFGRMTSIVQQHGGFVDKFIGDGILAVFGAPSGDPDHATSAVAAALEMVDACHRESDLTINGQQFGIRIGVHSGDAIVGNIGSPNRFNYTVVGDSVNLASRLEGVGKRYHTTIIVSEQTRQAVGDQFAFRELDLVRVVGRDHPVRLFAPLPADAALAQDDANWRLALSAWRQGDFPRAANICDILAAAGDEIAATFAERAHKFTASPPAIWDGIVNLSEK
jgi:class 3 adenylate cyclase